MCSVFTVVVVCGLVRTCTQLRCGSVRIHHNLLNAGLLIHWGQSIMRTSYIAYQDREYKEKSGIGSIRPTIYTCDF